MSRLKSLILEIHRRSLWQVLAIYIGTAWLVLQAVEVLTSGYGLPRWFPAVAAALLLLGLPFVLATAFVQEGGPVARRSDPTLLPDAERAPTSPQTAAGGGAAGGLGRVFNWRNAILIGVLLFAVWGVLAAGWLAVSFPGLVVKAEAADFFSARDRVVVARFEGASDQAALGLAVREAVVTDLDQSPYVRVVARAELVQVLDRMRLPETTAVDEAIALEIARREGYPAVVVGSVTRLGAGYQVTARIVESSSGEVAVRVRETAADDGEVVAAVERLSRLLRRHLGESLSSLHHSKPLPEVTTASLAALQLLARGREAHLSGDDASAIPFFQQAVALDTAFAAAYRALAVANSNTGMTSAGQANIEKAYRHAERLVEQERYMTGAIYHSYRRQYDSAAYYYRLMLSRDPEDFVATNNLGDIYERMGRYEEALPLYRRVVEIQPTGATGYLNVASVAATLGLHAVAESALVVMRERFPGSFSTLYAEFAQALYAGEFERADAAARELAADPKPVYGAWGQWLRSSMAGMYGQVDRALALADSSMELAGRAEARLALYLAFQTAAHTALAAGAPGRARRLLERVREEATEDPASTFRHLAFGLIAEGHALAGELSRARSTLAGMDSLVEAEGFRPWGIAERARALIALQQDRPEASLEHLRSSRAADYGVLSSGGRLLLGDAYAALGRLADAAAQYDTLTITYGLNFIDIGSYGPLKPLAHERAGAVYLALGDTAAALKHLAAFAQLWRNADTDLQPRVESARRTLAALAGEPP